MYIMNMNLKNTTYKSGILNIPYFCPKSVISI